MAGKDRYISISLLRGVAEAVDDLMEELNYWPSRGAFLREAALEKIRIERQSLKEATWINRSKETYEMSEEEKKPEEEKPEEEEPEEEEEEKKKEPE